MTLAELEEELECASDKNQTNLMSSILCSILKKAFGPKKLEYMKRLVAI